MPTTRWTSGWSVSVSTISTYCCSTTRQPTTIRPAVLQNETHPYHQSRSVKAHIAEDYDIFDFSLTPDDMQRINTLECGHRFASY